IGRSKTYGIMHGIEGAKILKDYPELAKICERHIGAGIPREEAIKLGLGNKDYIPETLEEKIITHADNLISGNKEVSIEETIKEYDEKFGKDCIQGKRIMELAKYIESLMKK
ncbi:MAG: HD domain-containing protein, partial [Sulfurihydrogenibium azorense]